MMVGSKPTVLYAIMSVIGRGSTPTLISTAFRKSQWNSCMKRQDTSIVRKANKQSLSVIGLILLHVRIGKLCVRKWFRMVDKLAVDLHLGTSFIDHYIWTISYGEHKLVPWHLTPVAIIASHNTLACSLERSNGPEKPDSNISAPVTVSKIVLLAHFTQQIVQAVTLNHGLLNVMFIKAEEQVSRTGIVPSVGVTDVALQRPFSFSYQTLITYRHNSLNQKRSQ